MSPDKVAKMSTLWPALTFTLKVDAYLSGNSKYSFGSKPPSDLRTRWSSMFTTHEYTLLVAGDRGGGVRMIDRHK